MSEPAAISPTRIRAKKAARLAVQGVDYAQIADVIGTNAKPEYKRQITYSLLQTSTGKAEVQRLEKELARKYTVEDCFDDIDDAITMAKGKTHVPGFVQALALKAKVAGLLIDQVKDVTEPAQKEALDQKAAKSLSELKVSAEGIETEADKVANAS
jgi:hypothetical protein